MHYLNSSVSLNSIYNFCIIQQFIVIERVIIDMIRKVRVKSYILAVSKYNTTISHGGILFASLASFYKVRSFVSIFKVWYLKFHSHDGVRALKKWSVSHFYVKPLLYYVSQKISANNNVCYCLPKYLSINWSFIIPFSRAIVSHVDY